MSWRALTIHTCDLCGATVEMPGGSQMQPDNWASLSVTTSQDDGFNHDLCGDCVAALQAWLAVLKAERKGDQ